MPSPIPAALALNVVSNGTTADASPVEANFVNIQAAVNALSSALSGGVAGQLLSAADGTDVQWVNNIRYRKTTAKIVSNSVAETDLLNSEITIGAGVLGTTGRLRATLDGHFFNNTGATQALPHFKLKMGATTLVDLVAPAAVSWGSTVASMPWRMQIDIANLGATNSQWVAWSIDGVGSITAATAAVISSGRGIYWSNNVNDTWGANAQQDGAIDTTVAQALAVTAILPTANANCVITLGSALVEII